MLTSRPSAHHDSSSRNPRTLILVSWFPSTEFSLPAALSDDTNIPAVLPKKSRKVFEEIPDADHKVLESESNPEAELSKSRDGRIQAAKVWKFGAFSRKALSGCLFESRLVYT